jgi:hypothetical protein
MLHLIIPLLLTLLCGCQTTPKANLIRFNNSNDPIYPAISIVMTSEELGYIDTRRIVIDALNESNVFESVQVNNPYNEFAIELYIETRPLTNDNGIKDFVKVVLFGSTLGIFPLYHECEAEGKAKLRFRGIVFDEFDVTCKHSSIITILNLESDDVGTYGAYRKIVEKVIEMIIERRSFENLIQEIEDEYRAIEGHQPTEVFAPL